MLLNTGGSFSV